MTPRPSRSLRWLSRHELFRYGLLAVTAGRTVEHYWVCLPDCHSPADARRLCGQRRWQIGVLTEDEEFTVDLVGRMCSCADFSRDNCCLHLDILLALEAGGKL